MPTNFTVVPVEDADSGSNSGSNSAAAAGSGKLASLGKIFGEDDGGSHSGRNTVYIKNMLIHLGKSALNILLFLLRVMWELERMPACTG